MRRLSKWNILLIDVDTTITATELQERYGYSYWDSAVIASAIKGGAQILLSEDLADGQKIQGVMIRNPFN